jgi:branched-chain amino acid transport system permease protein
MFDFYLNVFVYVCFQGILGLGLNIQYGLCGLLNLAYIGFMAAGAYTTAVVVLPKATLAGGTTYILGLSLPFYVGMILAMAVAGLLAFVIGAVILGRKLEAEYFAILTLVTVVVLSQVVTQESSIFNGGEGLISIPQPFGAGLTPRRYTESFLLFAFGCLVVVFIFCEVLRRSPLGRTLRSVREDDVAAQAFGRNVFRLKLKAFVIGAMIAGLAGSLTVLYVGAFAPSGWGVAETILALTCVFLGGAGNMKGTIVATVVVVVCVQSFQNIPTLAAHPGVLPELQLVFIAVLLLSTLAFRPQGILPERSRRFPISVRPGEQPDPSKQDSLRTSVGRRPADD